MSVESARAYITRMRGDESFRHAVNAFDDEEASWQFLKDNGFEFSIDEFKKAQDLIYKEYGITPL